MTMLPELMLPPQRMRSQKPTYPIASAKNANVIPMKIRSCMSLRPPLNLAVEREYGSEYEQMLRWRQPDSGSNLAPAEKAAARPTRIVEAVFQAKDGGRLAKWNATFERACYGLDGLVKAGPTAAAIPRHFRPYRCTPVLVECPMRGDLRGNPGSSWVAGCGNFLACALVFKRHCKWL